MLEKPFLDRTQELLKAGKVIVACDASVKNSVMGALWVMMKREREEIIIHEIHAKDWSLNTSKTS